MAGKPPKSPSKLKPSNTLANVEEGLGPLPKEASKALIRDVMMRRGGEPFGAPFEIGLGSLTKAVVRRFKLRGFFGFETLEKLKKPNRRNRFTKHGAARFMGKLDKK